MTKGVIEQLDSAAIEVIGLAPRPRWNGTLQLRVVAWLPIESWGARP
jgi:hypothetical protein